MRLILLVGVLGGATVLFGPDPRKEPAVVITEVIDETPPPSAIAGRAVLAGPGDYTCHDGALGIRIQRDRGQQRLEIVFDRDTQASHSVELAAPPAATEWFVVADRAECVWYVRGASSILRVDWRTDPVTGQRTLSETSYVLPQDAGAVTQANPPGEVASRLARHQEE